MSDFTQEAVNSPQRAYRRYGPALVRKAERVLRNPDDAMDVVQQLFADFFEKPPRSFELPFLYTSVTRRCLNLLRDQGRRQRLLQQQESTQLHSRSHQQLVMDLNLTTKLIDRLDKKSAEIVVYHYLDEMNQDEVAEILGMSRRAVVKRLTKIRELASSLSRAASQGDGEERGAQAQ